MDDQEIDDQLKQLDQINSIINGMKNGSEEERQKYTEKADKLLSQKSRVVIDKTRINPNASSVSSVNPNAQQNPTFAAMERDAEERYQRKVKLEGNVILKITMSFLYNFLFRKRIVKKQ